MTAVVLQFAISASIIILAGSFLSHFADAIAERTGLGRLLIGSILLAGATSMPELSVDINAARIGQPDIAVGNLMGAGLFNLLTLGIIDLFPSSRGRVLSRISVAHALPATLSITLTALAGIAIVTRAELSIYGVGAGSLAILLAYVYGIRLMYLDQRLALPAHVEPPGAAPRSVRPAALIRVIVGFSLSAAAIVAAAPYLADAAGELADRTGLGGTFVGTTLVALSTTLPELVSSLAALRLGAPDLALGNVFGSNVFNMVLLVPVDFAYTGNLFGAISTTHGLTCMATIVVTSFVVMGQLYQSEERVRLIEPDGLLVIGLVLGSLAMIYYQS